VRDTLRITDRAYILDEGAVLVEGNPADIAADERARKRFLGDDFALL
jgi:lipopolysaccharide export system ATP-binding protein